MLNSLSWYSHIIFPETKFCIYYYYSNFLERKVKFKEVNWMSKVLCVHGQSCLTLSWGLPAIILEWVAISYSRGSFWLRNQTHVSYISCISRWILYQCTIWEALNIQGTKLKKSGAKIGNQVFQNSYYFHYTYFFFLLQVLKKHESWISLN